MSQCEHVFGYREGWDEAWLEYRPIHPSEYMYPDVQFKFCPLCGEELVLCDWGAE